MAKKRTDIPFGGGWTSSVFCSFTFRLPMEIIGLSVHMATQPSTLHMMKT